MMDKKKPERMCVACRKRAEKEALLRVVKDKNGVLMVDLTGKAEGRGAYVCAEEACVAAAEKKSCLSRAFKMRVEGEIYERLRSAAEERKHNGR